jgi:uncharacterized protein (TIGR02611 family)
MKRTMVAIMGFTVLGIGVAMIILPGPAFILIPLGLGILATEFLWARKLLKKIKDKLNKKRGGPKIEKSGGENGKN